MFKKGIKWIVMGLGICTALLIVVFIGFVVAQMVFWADQGPFSRYWGSKFSDQSRPFLIQAFDKMPPAIPGQKALVLAGELVDQDLIFPLQKGFDVIALDHQLVGFELIPPRGHAKAMKVVVEPIREFGEDFKTFNLSTCPPLGLLMASHVLPFYRPEDFKPLWQKLTAHVEPGGYFIGTFLGPDTTYFSPEERKGMTLLTKEEVLALFKGWKIIAFSEVKQAVTTWEDREKAPPLRVEHLYEVFAQKEGMRGVIR